MASTRFIGINVSSWPEGADVKFLGEMSNIIHSGDGSMGKFSQKLILDDATPLRLLVGMPKTDLLPQHKKFAEVFYNYLFNASKDGMPTIWTGKPNWHPVNPGREVSSIKDSRLDYDFIMTLGLRSSTWENNVFLTELVRAKRNQSSVQETVRFYLALSMFGFSRPEQFFTAR